MPAPIQVSMFFKQGNSGWSEVLGMNPEQFTDLATAKKEVARAGGLGQLRVQLLGSGAELIGIRLSKYGVWRDSQYIAKAPGVPAGNIWNNPYASGTYPAVQPWDVFAIRFQAGDSYRRITYLSGVPDPIYSMTDPNTWTEPFKSDFQNYVQYISGTGDYLKGRFGTIVSSKNTTDPPGNNVAVGAAQAPTFAVVGGQGQITLGLTDNTRNITQGQKVRILGVRGQPGIDLRKWNGIFTVVNSQVATQFTVASKVMPDQATFTKLDWTQAYVWVPQPMFVKFDGFAIEGKTHRKRGVAFGTPRGRVRTRE